MPHKNRNHLRGDEYCRAQEIGYWGGKMKPFSRREMLKGGLLAPAVAAAAHRLGPISAAAIQAAQNEPASLSNGEAKPGGGRERLLLDFGWRFHLGNANDAAKDF